MRPLLIVWIVLEMINHSVQAQARPLAKLYLYNSYSDYQLATAPNHPLQIGSKSKTGYALVETDLDSLGFVDPTGQTVYLVLEPGKVYYYGYDNHSGAYRDMTPNAFWLSVATLSKYYRHYSVTRQSGVVKIE